MVREARLALEEAKGLPPLCLRERFEDTDDALLDHLPAASESAATKRPLRKSGQQQPPSKTDPPRRHLAGADWLGDYFPAPRRPVRSKV